MSANLLAVNDAALDQVYHDRYLMAAQVRHWRLAIVDEASKKCGWNAELVSNQQSAMLVKLHLNLRLIEGNSLNNRQPEFRRQFHAFQSRRSSL